MRCFNRYIFPAWEGRPFLDIRRGAVNELLDDIAAENGKVMADKIKVFLSKLMNWYESQ